MTIFLNINLDFIIYFELLEGYFLKGKIGKALKILYSLKQLTRLWNLNYKNALFAYSFKILEINISVYK